jgi:hypothetical protein
LAKASTTERTLAAAGAVGLIGGSLAVAFFNPSTAGFFPVCPLFSMTGIACPGCGLTRGFHALSRGDIVSALDYNALLPFYAFILGYFLVSLILLAVKGQGLSFKIFRPKMMWSFLAISLVFAVVRNLPVYPFNVLYP